MRAQLKTHSEFLMVFVLFVAFRLMMVLLFTPASFLTRGYTDFMYYYDMAALSAQGFFPHVHFWFEYPPVFPYLAIAVYQATHAANEGMAYFSRMLALVLLPFDMSIVINLYRIARRLYDPAVAVRLAWVYAMLLLPIFFWQYSFDTMVAALTLQAFYWLLTQHRVASAVMLAVAIATKFSPAFLIGTAWRFAPGWRSAAIYTGIVIGGVVLIFAPFAMSSPAYTLASFQSLISVSAWDTVWALLDGNINYGDVGGLPRHFDLALAGVPLHNPSSLPMWGTLIPFAAIFFFILTRRWERANPRHFMIFTGITLMLFHLWSKGWSPQWITLLLPFILLFYPNWRGVLLAIVFSFGALLDWPLAFAMASPPLYILGVFVRTGLFILIGLDLYLEWLNSQRMKRKN